MAELYSEIKVQCGDVVAFQTAKDLGFGSSLFATPPDTDCFSL